MQLESYECLTKQAIALIESETDFIANLANISALLYSELSDINWVGFYLVKQGELVLGPFQGKPACVRIPVGKGVCGTAITKNCVQRINDVHQFDGHIACDAQSNSELVIPFNVNHHVAGVLDIDSPSAAAFSEIDEKGLTTLMQEIEQVLNSHANNR